MKKVKLLFLLSGFLLLLLGCSNNVGSFGNPVEKFKTQVKANQYNDAIETFTNKIDGNALLETEAAEYLKEYLNDSWQSYLDEKISKKDFDVILLTVQRIGESVGSIGRDLEEIEEEYPIVVLSKESYQNGLSQMLDEDYEAAMESFSQVTPTDKKNYQDAEIKYNQAQEQYIKAIVATSIEKMNMGDFDGAANIIDSAEQTIGYETAFENAKTKIATNYFEAQMKVFDESENFDSMYSLYNQALENEYCVISAEMTTIFSDCQQKYRQNIIERSINAYKTSGYKAAVPIINEGLAVMPEDDKLLYYYELYSSCAPVSINDLKEVDEYTGSIWSEVYSRSYEEDAFGNQYQNCYFYWAYYSDLAYNELLLDGLYSSLSAKVFVTENTSRDSVVRMKIYADGVPVFDSGLIDRQTNALSVNLDLRNVRLLKIEASTDGNCGGGIAIGNTVLYRTIDDKDLLADEKQVREPSAKPNGNKTLQIRYEDDERKEFTISPGEIVRMNAFLQSDSFEDRVKWTTDDLKEEYVALTVDGADERIVYVECIKYCDHSITLFAEANGLRAECQINFRPA